MPPRSARRAVRAVAALACVLALAGCRRKHVPVTAVPELGYPACGDAGAEALGVSVGRGHIRSGQHSTERNVVERFDLRGTPCGYAFHARQEWPLATSDVEVRFDASLTPLWAWKRMTIPGSQREDGNAEIRRYDLRTGEVFIKKRDAQGQVSLEKLLPGGRLKAPAGARIGAVIGPGRGLITAWLQRAKLPVGGKSFELVLDFRAMVESLEEATLRRDEDLFEPSLGKTVRVYTFFGRETVFADENDVVVGDLAGMRPSDSLSTPEPRAVPMYGEPDPVHLP